MCKNVHIIFRQNHQNRNNLNVHELVHDKPTVVYPYSLAMKGKWYRHSHRNGLSSQASCWEKEIRHKRRHTVIFHLFILGLKFTCWTEIGKYDLWWQKPEQWLPRWGRMQGTFTDAGNVLYFELHDSDPSTRICKNSLRGTVQIYAIYSLRYMYFILQ